MSTKNKELKTMIDWQRKSTSKARKSKLRKPSFAQVAIIMGSQNDFPVMKSALEALQTFGIHADAIVVSAHRTPEQMYTFAKSAADYGYKIIIAGAGGAAHLPGMVASLTQLPVIGVPICVGKLKGLDALLSVAQMPKGVPVATVSVDNAYNAGLLAARILGTHDKILSKKLKKYSDKLKNKILRTK